MTEITPEDAKHTKRSRRFWIVVGTIITVLVIISLVFTYLILFDSESLMGPPTPLRIVSVTFSPEDPNPGDKLTITANVEGASFQSRPSVSVEVVRSKGGTGGGSMVPLGNNKYQYQTRQPIPDGTEIWFIVSASTDDEGPIFSEIYTLQVGDIIRDGPSGLKIENVTFNPENPTTLDTVVVNARIISDVNITDARFSYVYFTKHGSGGGSGSMLLENGNNYTKEIKPMGPGGRGFERGVTYFCRVAATDETGATALSEVFSFTIS